MAKPILRMSVVGHQYGRWTVLDDAPDRVRGDGGRVRYVLCRCYCGIIREVQLGLMRSGYSLSCGCATRQAVSRRQRTHGQKGTPEYRAWINMNYRCHSVPPGGTGFDDYRGRGISVCERWRHSFEHFLADMGKRPSPQHSLDRIDVNGHYEPANCRWATVAEQNRNTRANWKITYNGETRCVSEWAALFGLNFFTLVKRLQNDWDFERAITTPPRATWNIEARKANSAGLSAGLLY